MHSSCSLRISASRAASSPLAAAWTAALWPGDSGHAYLVLSGPLGTYATSSGLSLPGSTCSLVLFGIVWRIPWAPDVELPGELRAPDIPWAPEVEAPGELRA